VEALKSMGGLPEAFLQDRDLLDFFLPTLRADLTAFETWAPAPEAPVEIPLTVLGGLHDAHPLAHRLGEWAPETTATCEVRTFPGGHFYLQDRATEILALVEQTLRPRLL
jgi:surfactin synthase thioesterase subunit